MINKKITCLILACITAVLLSACGDKSSKVTFSATPEPSSEESSEQSESKEKKEKIELTPVSTVIDTDFTAVTSDVSEYLGSDYSEFEKLAECLNSGETSFDFSSDDAQTKILGCVSALPVSDYVNIEDSSVSYLVSSNEIKDNLSDIDNFFQAFVTDYGVNEDMTDFEKATLVYKYVASFSYDASENTMLEALEYQSCSDLTSARIFTWFMTQLGVNSRLISCTLTDGSLHYFSAVKIDSKYYAFDATLENQNSGGSGLDYFMMSSSRAKTVGLGASFYSGMDAYFNSEFSLTVDTSKDSLFGDTTLWSLDSDAHILYISKEGDSYGEYSLSFNTMTLSEIQG